ncbi:MAG: NADP-dependent oxidoreductase [Myxococcota bacterium]
MRAYVLEKKSRVPVLHERPEVAVGPGEVMVRTQAVAIHPVDLETRDGSNAMMLPFKRPFVPGVDYVGTVMGVGAGVTDLDEGMRVYGYRGVATMGAFSEVLAVPRSELAQAPKGFGVEQVATFALPSLCALQALDEAELKQPGTVLVHGGAGGVGSVAVQLLASYGHRITATASAKNAAWVHKLGAQEVIDYRTTRFEEVMRDVDLVFDTVGSDTLKRSFQVVRPGGTVVSISAMPQAQVLRDAGFNLPLLLGWALPLMTWSIRRTARRAGAKLVGQVTVPSGVRLAEAARIAEERGLETRIDRVFPFEQLPQAIDHMESGARGRVVVRMA